MKKTFLILFLIVTSFFMGFAVKSFIEKKQTPQNSKVTGIGGIFFKCKDTKMIKDWYQKNLGLNTNQYGAVFEWYQGADSTKKGFTQWSPFKETTNYFAPSTKDFMINYRVSDLVSLIKELNSNGVTILDTIETYDYGKFVHIMDPEGNKIELWEPNDVVYEQMGNSMNLKTTK